MFFICMLMPASISIFTDRKINGKEEKNSDLILKYLFYTFLITTIMNTFIYIFSNERFAFYSNETFTYDFCLKYMWASIIIALILPYIVKIISTNININLELKEKKRNEKAVKKNKKRKSNKNN